MPTALPLLVLAYALGIGLGDALCVGRRGGVIVLLAAVGLAGALWRGRWVGVALLLLALGAGVAAQGRRGPDAEAALGQLLGGDLDAPQLCEGRIVAPPVSLGDGLLLRVAVDRLAAPTGQAAPPAGWRALSPPLLVAVTVHGEARAELAPGDRVRLRARLRPPGGLRNPGAPDPLRRAQGDGIAAQASVEPDGLLRWADAPPPSWADAPPPVLPSPQRAWLAVLRAVGGLRGRMLAQVRARLLPDPTGDPTSAALVAGLVLGERAALAQADAARQAAGQRPLDEVFRAAGISHVLSVSGLHLAVASYLFFQGVTALLLRVTFLSRRLAVRRLAALLALPATALYTLLTGAEVATLRAAGVLSLYFVAVLCGRRARLPETLAATVLVILLAAPLRLFDASLQLSVAAVLGTAYLRPLRGLLRAFLSPRPQDAVARLAQAALRLLDASLGALLSTAPLCALHFSEFQCAGLLGNLLAVPLGELLVVPVGLGGATLALASPAAGGPLLDLAGAAAALMTACATGLAGWGLLWSAPPPHPLLLLGYAAGLCALGRRLRAGWPAGLCLLAYLGGLAWPSQALRATFLDVGQGDAAVLELPGGAVVVVDAGGLGEKAYDPGLRVVLPHLRRRGHRRIDLLVASHPHPDHVGGFVALLDGVPVGRLWAAPGVAGERPDPSWLRVLDAAARRGVPVEPPRPLWLGGVQIEPLSPCPVAATCQIAAHPGRSHNDNSVVLRIGYAGRALLLPGDLELAGELLLLDRTDLGIDIRADVLKVPHHGSRTSSSESFLRAVGPTWAVCSLGRRNRYGFPHPEVSLRYREAGIALLRTDQEGAVEVTITAAGRLQVETLRGATPAPTR